MDRASPAAAALACAAAYLLGAVPFGVLFARLRGVDLRKVGSGNIGATNAARALGKRIGLLVFLCDAAKGYLPVLLAHRFLPSDVTVAAVGACAFLGHLTSPFLGFRGGKGVATAFGVFFALAPLPAVVALVIFVLAYALTRISAVGSLLATTAFFPSLWLRGGTRAELSLAALMWCLIVWKHRENIARLLRRQENRV